MGTDQRTAETGERSDDDGDSGTPAGHLTLGSDSQTSVNRHGLRDKRELGHQDGLAQQQHGGAGDQGGQVLHDPRPGVGEAGVGEVPGDHVRPLRLQPPVHSLSARGLHQADL